MIEKKNRISLDRLAFLVDNAINIAKSHKKKCDGDCDCNIFLLGLLCIEAGAKLTNEQLSIFI